MADAMPFEVVPVVFIAASPAAGQPMVLAGSDVSGRVTSGAPYSLVGRRIACGLDGTATLPHRPYCVHRKTSTVIDRKGLGGEDR